MAYLDEPEWNLQEIRGPAAARSRASTLDLPKVQDCVVPVAYAASALESGPSTPWHQAARAIADADFAHSVELVASIGAASPEAYARLRAAEELMRAGRSTEANNHLEPALAFFRNVGATRYLVKAEELCASGPSGDSSRERGFA